MHAMCSHCSHAIMSLSICCADQRLTRPQHDTTVYQSHATKAFGAYFSHPPNRTQNTPPPMPPAPSSHPSNPSNATRRFPRSPSNVLPRGHPSISTPGHFHPEKQQRTPPQVIALCAAPFLLQHPKVGELFPADAINRAKKILAAFSGGIGAYQDSRGNSMVRQEVANFIKERDGFAADPNVSDVGKGGRSWVEKSA